MNDHFFRAWHEAELPFDEEAGRERFLHAVAGKRARRRLPARAGGWMLAAAAMLVCVLGFVWWRAPRELSFVTTSGPGQAGAWLATGQAGELPLTFSEGTHVVLASDSRGRVEQLDSAGAIFVLERGEVRAHVVHRTRTDWRFRAGPFDVQVTGTQLGVTWNPERERFTVRVDEGAVVVHGPSIGAMQVVRAGERCVVDLPSRSMRVSPIDDPTAAASAPSFADAASDDLAAASSASAPADAAVAPPSPPAVPWTRLEERGEYQAAYAAAKAAGFASILRSASADELLRLAQVSELSGHGDDGRSALLSCRRRFAGSEPAAVAAYELGRVSGPVDAARWFGLYLAEEPAGPLAREASGRRLEALASSGKDDAARDAARDYLARYPHGAEAALAQRLVSGGR